MSMTQYHLPTKEHNCNYVILVHISALYFLAEGDYLGFLHIGVYLHTYTANN